VERDPLTPLRCVIDSMVFDAIADDRALLDEVDRLTRARRLELLAALETMEEIAATPDEDHRRRLRKVRVLVVPPPSSARGDRRLARMRAGVGVSEEDARIAVTAAAHGVPLVTEDRDLAAAAAAHLPDTPIWHWLTDLLPRIEELAAQLPAPPRRWR
jgi:predicted nucleic acid-binding protein